MNNNCSIISRLFCIPRGLLNSHCLNQFYVTEFICHSSYTMCVQFISFHKTLHLLLFFFLPLLIWIQFMFMVVLWSPVQPAQRRVALAQRLTKLNTLCLIPGFHHTLHLSTHTQTQSHCKPCDVTHTVSGQRGSCQLIRRHLSPFDLAGQWTARCPFVSDCRGHAAEPRHWRRSAFIIPLCAIDY